MERIKKVKESIKNREVDALLIDSPYEILWILERYESYNIVELSLCMLITKEEVYLIGDSISLEKIGNGDFKPIKADIHSFLLNNYTYSKEINELLSSHNVKKLGLFRRGQESLNVTTVILDNFIADIAMVKTEEELKLIRKACEIGDKVIESTVYNEGMTEIDLRHEIEVLVYKKGGEKRAFPATCAFGDHTQDPQPVPGIRELKDGDLIRIEFGVIYKGYPCDISRSYNFGKVSEKVLEIYRYVTEAYEETIKFIKPGRLARTVDAIARDYFKEKGLGDYFLSILGYPVGMIRGGLFLGPSCNGVLKSGMVFSIAPMLCIPKWGGIKIGDVVLVTDDGCEVLTKASRELSR